MLAIEHEGSDFGSDLNPQQLDEHAARMAELDALTSKLLGDEA
jgi:hypothetical protein